jgi:hypothetical protein
MIYVRLEGEAPAVALQEMTNEFPVGVLRQIALNLWGQDDDDIDHWDFITENGGGVHMEDDDQPASAYGVQETDLLLLRPRGPGGVPQMSS